MSSNRTNRKFTQEFKTEAAKLVTAQGYTCIAAAEAVGIHVSLMSKWVRAFRKSTDPTTAFPGKGHLKPNDEELAQLRKQLKNVTMERDILKKAIVGSIGQCNRYYSYLDCRGPEYEKNIYPRRERLCF